jgi:hypothetical protein
MSEPAHIRASHLKAMGVSGALGVAGVSVGAYILWHQHHEEPRIEAVSHTDEAIFEETRLTDEQRRLMARVAVCVYSATAYTGNGVVQQAEIATLLNVRKREAQGVIGYLKPKSEHVWDKQSAYLDRRMGVVDHKAGYFALSRLVELIEVGGSPTLDYAIVELADEHAGKDFMGQLNTLQRTINLPPPQNV